MKNTIKTTLTLAFCLMFSIVASAQMPAPNPYSTVSSGTGTIAGTIVKAVDLRSSGESDVDNGATVTSLAAQNSTLAFQLDFPDISPNNNMVGPTDQFVYGSIGIQLRSNCDYVVKMWRASNVSVPDAAGNTGTFSTGDIGFGILPVAAVNGGANLFASATTVNNTGGFDKPTSFPYDANTSITNGYPSYTKSLNNIGVLASKTDLFTGGRISNGGDNTTSNNAIKTKLRFAVKPQYYAVGAMNATVNWSQTLSVEIVPNP